LSGKLSSVFNSDDGSPHGGELISSSWLEAIISSDWSWGIVRWSSGNLGVSISIVGKEGSIEFSRFKFSITGTIVSGNEKINFFISGINTNGIKSGIKFLRRNSSTSVSVEDIEGISKVEVWFSGEVNLGVLKILFVVAEILKGMDELIFIVWSEFWSWG
jgi:hypothetical protein